MPLTELIMKDPASDFFLKHQPLEYYKCQLHAVLEKGREGGWRCGRKGKVVMKQKVMNSAGCLYLTVNDREVRCV